MALKISNEPFQQRLKKSIGDDFKKGAISQAQDVINGRRRLRVEEVGNWEEWRDLSEKIRKHTLQNLDYYLNMFCENAEKNGTHVYFAKTKEEANCYIQSIVDKKNAKKIVKSKSMVSEEIDVNHVLKEMGCDVTETDLAEWILQVDDWDVPSHIIVPALHKDRNRIHEVFTKNAGYTGTNDPTEMAKFAREKLREKFLEADVGITGCNFGIAETGSVSLVTNEGNGRMVTTVPKTQITLMGMERLIPTFEEFEVLVGMLVRSSVGTKITSYVSVTTGPRKSDEVDGPDELHVVILDNGRSKILQSEFQSMLQCIRCGACLNICPVYRHVSGHTYGSIYSGPMGAVLTPLLDGYETNKELPYASTLCGACSEVCPVKIPLHELLLKHRQIIVEQEGKAPLMESILFKGAGMFLSKPGVYDFGTKLAPSFMKLMSKDGKITKGYGMMNAWTDSRDLPVMKKEKFRDWFEKRKKGGSQR